MVYSTRTTMPLLMPSIAAERRWSKSNSGTILSSFFWGYCFTQILGGYLSDRYGGQRVILFSSIVWSVITIIMPNVISISSNLSTFLALPFIVFVRIINGASQGVHFPALMSITSQNLNASDRTSFFSMLTSGSAFGTLLTGVLGSFLLDYMGWTWVFQVIGFMGLSWTLLLRYYTMSSSFKRRQIINVSSGYRLCSNAGGNDEVPWLKILASGRMWACLMAHSCTMNCFFVLLSWLPTYFHENFPHAKPYVVNMLPWLMVPVFTVIAKCFTDYLLARKCHLTTARKLVQATCYIVQSLTLFIVTQTSNFYVSLISLSVCIGVMGFHNAAVTVNPQDLSPNHSGSVFGLMNTLGSIFGFLGIYLAGHILELTQSNWSAVFNCLIFINSIGLLIFSAFGSSEPIT